MGNSAGIPARNISNGKKSENFSSPVTIDSSVNDSI